MRCRYQRGLRVINIPLVSLRTPEVHSYMTYMRVVKRQINNAQSSLLYLNTLRPGQGLMSNMFLEAYLVFLIFLTISKLYKCVQVDTL